MPSYIDDVSIEADAVALHLPAARRSVLGQQSAAICSKLKMMLTELTDSMSPRVEEHCHFFSFLRIYRMSKKFLPNFTSLSELKLHVSAPLPPAPTEPWPKWIVHLVRVSST